MRISQLAAGVAVAAMLPTMALAQQTCEQRQANRTVGTLAGAGIGALLGSAIAGHGDRTTGAVVGGLGGAVVGNQVSKSRTGCANAYGYYDNAGAWHANAVARQNATGYYDREGQWIDGAPNGYYSSNGRWVATTVEPAAAGYTDRTGHWIPASANGYYDANGRWVAGSAGGHYDSRGRWISGPATGKYDARGRWIPGRPARVTDVQPGYYDNGRWRPGPSTGYYDARGRWVAVDAMHDINARDDRPGDIAGRQAWLGDRIQRGLDDGTLTRAEGGQALRRLQSIDRETRTLTNRYGNLRPRDEQAIMAKLDDLSGDVREMRRGPVRQY